MGVEHEQRRHPRYGVRLSVRYSNAEQFVNDYVENLSADGLFIKGANQLPLHAETDIHIELPITVGEAIRGAEVEVPTLHGSKRLRVPAGTHHGTVQRLRGEGPPKLGSTASRGDIHYRFVIDVPASLNSEQSEVVEKLSQVMNGDPRAKLFAQARGGS